MGGTETGTGLSSIVPHCFGPSSCLGPSSAQCEYTITKVLILCLKVVCCTLAGIQALRIDDWSDDDAEFTWSRSAKEQ